MELVAQPIGSMPRKMLTHANDLRELSQQLEAAFLSEMLKHAGLERTPEAFGGGAGEEQFGSMLRDLQAKNLTENGGIGLAEAIYKSLEARQNV